MNRRIDPHLDGYRLHKDADCADPTRIKQD